MEVVNPNAAGIHIGSEVHYVAVPPDRDPESVRSFKCFMADLNVLADWLEECGVETVAMESTGVYWTALYQILEARGFEVVLVNARHVKNVPGRKTDVLDCQWLQQLHPGFIPVFDRRVIRCLIPHPYSQIQGQAWQRYQPGPARRSPMTTQGR
jgi:transposase